MECPLCINPNYDGPIDPELEKEHYEKHIKKVPNAYEEMIDSVLFNLFHQFDEIVASSELTKADVDKLTNLAREIRNYVRHKFEVNKDLETKLSQSEEQYQKLKHIIFSTVCDECFNAIMEKLEDEE